MGESQALPGIKVRNEGHPRLGGRESHRLRPALAVTWGGPALIWSNVLLFHFLLIGLKKVNSW